MFFFFFPPLKIYADTNTTPLVFFSRPSKKDLHLWRGFSSLNIFLCWSTLILRFFFFFFLSCVANILDDKDEKARTRTLEREIAAVLSYLFFPFPLLFISSSPSIVPSVMYVHRHARIYM